MAITYKATSDYSTLGVELYWSQQATTCKMAPHIYRSDAYDVSNSFTLFYSISEANGTLSNYNAGVSTYNPGGWSIVEMASLSERVYPRKGTDYKVYFRVATDASYGSAWGGSFHYIGEVHYDLEMTVPALDAPGKPTIGTNTRNSDTQNTITWSAPSGGGIVESYTVQRSVNGGAWVNIATGVNKNYTSYTDSTTTADNSYAYRVGAYNARTTTWSNSSSRTYNTPAAPTSASGTRASNTSIKVTVANSSKTATEINWQRSENGSSWPSTYNTSATLTSFTDNDAVKGYYYRVRNVYNKTLMSGWVTTALVPALSAPGKPAIGTNTRNSDTQNTVTWSAPTSGGPVVGYTIQRSANGDSWNTIATGVSSSARSYIDTSTTIDNSYKYRVGAYNEGSTTWSNESNATVNTPAAPVSISGSRTANASVKLTVENRSRTATKLQWQRSVDGQNWPVGTNESSNLSEFSDNDAVTGYYYRVRNTYGSLVSDWVAMAGKLPDGLSTANPPVINEPVAGSVLKFGQEVLIRWTHRPTDGTAQSEARVMIQNPLGGIDTFAVRGESNEFAYTPQRSGVYVFSVATAGSNGTLSGDTWQSNSVSRGPSVSLNVPSVVNNMPIAYTLDYTDDGFNFATGNIVVMDESTGEKVYEETLTDVSGEITASEFVPDSGNTYSMYVYVRSTSELTTETSASFDVRFVPPQKANVSVEDDRETGFASLTISLANRGANEVAAKTVYLYRVSGGRRKLLAQGELNGAGFIDRYAPLNTDYEYSVVTEAESGAIAQTIAENRIESSRFVLFNDKAFAWAMYNPGDSWKMNSSSSAIKHYEGRTEPVAYVGLGVEETHSYSFKLHEREQTEGFRDLIRSGSVCVCKDVFGAVFRAFVKLNGTTKYTENGRYGTVTVAVTKIDDEGLL